jgi:hypothetical protein
MPQPAFTSTLSSLFFFLIFDEDMKVPAAPVCANTCFKSSTSTALRPDLEMEEPYVGSHLHRNEQISLPALHMGYVCAQVCDSFGLLSNLQKQNLCVHTVLDRPHMVTKSKEEGASGFVPRGQFQAFSMTGVKAVANEACCFFFLNHA